MQVADHREVDHKREVVVQVFTRSSTNEDSPTLVNAEDYHKILTEMRRTALDGREGRDVLYGGAVMSIVYQARPETERRRMRSLRRFVYIRMAARKVPREWVGDRLA